MGIISPPMKVKAIIGLLYHDAERIAEAIREVEERYGPVDYSSPAYPFAETQYYDDEMGEGLTRQYVSLRDLIDPDELMYMKILTNDIEDRMAVEGKRIVNLDPGYIGAANLVLASTKNFKQRVYIGSGIYAEVTMIFQKEDFQLLPWTYPDYYNHRDAFCEMRKIWRGQLKAMEDASKENE